MNREEIARQIVLLSGHWELVADAAGGDFTDPTDGPGVSWFINAGQRYLDRKFEYKKDQCWLLKPVAAEQRLVTFEKARYISEVWASTTSGGRYRLTPKQDSELRGVIYPDTEPPTGGPLYWSPCMTRVAPEQDTPPEPEEGEDEQMLQEYLEGQGITDLSLVDLSDGYLTDSILLWPIPEEAVTLEVLARWYSKELVADEDVSFWSVNEPGLLVKAARMEIESELHRNKEGANAFKEEILEGLRDCYFALLREQMAGPASRHRMLGG